ncbi:hypothetical protein PC9H_005378 [Pleurotus ostreatus]|uniref:Uncharacterized protein n=1 Tax=Pleurotus ostreatus TaxID=5322 RepID=A0A8H6ZZF1_PLEOS|nr:uncharacterized protein PC9H_005378 [Pleurotus ostreatus]KAF7433426.1 hypothetical protein PC9H_005378 [Pleurotus ostreatus]KAJ8697875.1 hypothetical protein PTI98_004646 [Pleurotus ostreatus]
MMNKRVLTDETYQSNVESSNQCPASTPADLAAALRSVGARARKSVTEGYPTSRFQASAASSLPAKARTSSGTALFRSANDTLREVYSNAHYQSPCSSSSKKRARPDAGQSHSDDERHAKSDSDTEMNIEPTDSFIPSRTDGRVVRPLRKTRRALMQTQSLPTDVFRFSGGSVTETPDLVPLNPLTEIGEKDTEEDWSTDNFHPASVSSFQPASLE